MSIYDQNPGYADRDRTYAGGGRSYGLSGAGILTVIAAAILLGLTLLIGLSFIFSNQYEGMRGQNWSPGPAFATPIPDVRTPDLGNNTQQGAPVNP